MDQFQVVQLQCKLEECLLTGQTFITWAQIYAWYRNTRIGKRTWRDIQHNWSETCLEQEVRPVPELEIRGINPNAHIGGIRLVRAYSERFDMGKIKLSDIAMRSD